jgi:hypothetical protein
VTHPPSNTEKALAAAVEATTLIGRQGQELGALREVVAQMQEAPAEPAVQQVDYDADELEEWFEANPTKIPQVAATAFYQGNDTVMEAAIEAWAEHDRPAARAFDRQVTIMRARAEALQEVEASASQHQELTAAHNEVRQAWQQTATAFAEAHPDFVELAPKMREVAPQYPAIVRHGCT